MTDDERRALLLDLSRRMSGDLPAAEAARLEASLDDPEVAALWADMAALPDALAAIPLEAPPVHLDRAVLRRSPRSGLRIATGLGIAAAVAALILVPRPEAPIPEVALLAGDQVVSGRTSVVAGAVRVEIDGLARITVEPFDPVVRATEHHNPEDPMKAALAALGGAVGGAIVTVAVLKGTATVTTDEAAPATLHAGETRRISTEPRSPRAPAAIPEGEAPEQTIARLQADLEALQAQLGQARFTGAVASGQLEAHVGVPQDWPDDLDPALQPDAMRARAQAVADAHEGVELVEVDCSEYPCITILSPTEMSEAWTDQLRPAAEALAEGLSDVGLSVSASNFSDGDVSAGYFGVVVAPSEDADRNSEVGTRTHYRADALMEELGHEVLGEAKAEAEGSG